MWTDLSDGSWHDLCGPIYVMDRGTIYVMDHSTIYVMDRGPIYVIIQMWSIEWKVI
jgi:hypothetical protein